jgi:Na+-transporting NADH:ubiquinone oxidoreductase subunit NqrB
VCAASFHFPAPQLQSDQIDALTYTYYTKYTHQQLGANTATWESWLSHISFAPSTGFRNISMQNAVTAQLHGMMRESSKHFLHENSTVTRLLRQLFALVIKNDAAEWANCRGFHCSCVLLFFFYSLICFGSASYLLSENFDAEK